jgi:hypothetical protein
MLNQTTQKNYAMNIENCTINDFKSTSSLLTEPHNVLWFGYSDTLERTW